MGHDGMGGQVRTDLGINWIGLFIVEIWDMGKGWWSGQSNDKVARGDKLLKEVGR